MTLSAAQQLHVHVCHMCMCMCMCMCACVHMHVHVHVHVHDVMLYMCACALQVVIPLHVRQLGAVSSTGAPSKKLYMHIYTCWIWVRSPLLVWSDLRSPTSNH